MIAFLCKCGARPAKEVGWQKGYWEVDDVTVINTDEKGDMLFGGGRYLCNKCQTFGKFVCDGKEELCYGSPTWCNWHQCAPKVFR